jgi:hypothetical protein
MLLVALAGLALGGGVWGYRMWRLSSFCVAKAHQHWFEEYRAREAMAQIRTVVRDPDKLTEELAARAVYHAELGQKYMHAARYPWFAVEPDPPAP